MDACIGHGAPGPCLVDCAAKVLRGRDGKTQLEDLQDEKAYHSWARRGECRYAGSTHVKPLGGTRRRRSKEGPNVPGP